MFLSFFVIMILVALQGEGWQTYLPIGMLAKVFNLLLFVGLMVFFLRKPLGEAFKTRREGIRKELMRAREERDAALLKLEEIKTRLQGLDSEVDAVRSQAQKEAAAERARIERATEEDVRKLREQAQREIESAMKTARAELRSYAAEQSVRLAEEMIRRDIQPEDDARLVREYVGELGGIKH